jgi:hypothetical protein
MLTVVTYDGGGEVTRRKGWHLGDGKTTLCGITRPKWALPERRPRTRGCAVCQKVAGLDEPVRDPGPVGAVHRGSGAQS